MLRMALEEILTSGITMEDMHSEDRTTSSLLQAPWDWLRITSIIRVLMCTLNQSNMFPMELDEIHTSQHPPVD